MNRFYQLLLFIAVFIFSYHHTKAQNTNIDSLQALLNKHPQQDTTRINLLAQIAKTYTSKDRDKSIKALNEAISIAQKINDSRKLGFSYKTYGDVYVADDMWDSATQKYYKAMNILDKTNDSNMLGRVYCNLGITIGEMNDNATSIMYSKKALAIFETLDDKQLSGRISRTIGLTYQNISQYSPALEYYNKAFTYHRLMNNERGMSVTLNDIGVVYLKFSLYTKALEYYLESLAISERIKEKDLIYLTTSNIGIIYKKMGNYKKAIEYQQKAFDLAKEEKDSSVMGNALHNIAGVYTAMDQPDKAKAILIKSLSMTAENVSYRGKGNSYTELSKLYVDRNQFDSAILMSEKSITTFKEDGDKELLAGAINSLANIYLRAPDNILLQQHIVPSKKYESAIAKAKEALEMGKEVGSLERQSESWDILADAYEKNNDFKNALFASRQLALIKEKVLTDTVRLTGQKMMLEAESDKREAVTKASYDKKQLLVKQEVEKEATIKKAVIAGGLLLIASGITIFVFYKRRRDAKQLQHEAELKAEISETEMKALRSQMNPHFIFNSLNSIGDYIAKNDTVAADIYLARFAKLMRMILENSELQSVSIADDLKALEIYMQLEALRMKNKFTYSIHVDDTIDKDNTLIPPLILQPFVENSIWHGIAGKEGTGHINISITQQGDMIHCTVSDDGIGIASATSNKEAANKKSYGMKITRSRIDIINKQKKTNAAVHLYDLDNGTKVEVQLPLTLAF